MSCLCEIWVNVACRQLEMWFRSSKQRSQGQNGDGEAIVTSTHDSLSPGSKWKEGSRREAQREPAKVKVSARGSPEWAKTPRRSQRQERAAAFRKPREAERGTGFSARAVQGGFDNKRQVAVAEGR